MRHAPAALWTRLARAAGSTWNIGQAREEEGAGWQGTALETGCTACFRPGTRCGRRRLNRVGRRPMMAECGDRDLRDPRLGDPEELRTELVGRESAGTERAESAPTGTKLGAAGERRVPGMSGGRWFHVEHAYAEVKLPPARQTRDPSWSDYVGAFRPWSVKGYLAASSMPPAPALRALPLEAAIPKEAVGP